MPGSHWGGWGEHEYDPHEEWGPEYDEEPHGSEGDQLVPEGSEHLPEFFEIAPGMHMRINPYWFKQMMHKPEITALVDKRCKELTDLANSLAVQRHGHDKAEYTYYVSDNENNIRARGRVRPGNIDAQFDDAENSTLLKALGSVGSDPLPEQYAQRAVEPDEAYERYRTEHAEFHSDLEEEGSTAVPYPTLEGTGITYGGLGHFAWGPEE
jgi:hypothetical protein